MTEREKTEREKILDLKHYLPLEHKNYRILSNKSESKEGEIAEPLGEGGSGIVYLAEQNIYKTQYLKRAIKFFIYRDNIADLSVHKNSGRISLSQFLEELKNTASFNHENIIKIIDGGIINRNGCEIPFIITDYVEGHTLKQLIDREDLLFNYIDKNNRREIFLVFSQIIKGVSYLHKKNFYHCDIAPKNIFIKGEKNNFQIIIGDLGIGRTIDDYSLRADKEIFIAGTKSYCPPEVETVLNTKIKFKDFAKLQPKWDIYAIKKSFKELLIATYGKEFDEEWTKALINSFDKEYENIIEFCNFIEKISPEKRIIAGVPELSIAESASGINKILSPVQSVWLTRRMRKISRHPTMMRLKKVPQLLMAPTNFPGASHNRYEHSLGTYENMRLLLTSLLRKGVFIELFDKRIMETALVSALLSSLTRFPFSFVVHEIKESNKDFYPNINQKKLLDKLLEYKSAEEGVNRPIKEVINEFFEIDYDLLKEIISGKHAEYKTPKIQIISSLLNSSIDVRVLDFLRRDSLHLGIVSGSQIDFESIINYIEIYNNKIAINTRGVSYVEQVVSLRYWLYKQIYWNRPNRCYMAMLKYVFSVLHCEEFEKILIDNILFAEPIDILKLILNYCNSKNNIKIMNLVKNIIAHKPELYREIFVINAAESDSIYSQIIKTITVMDFNEQEKLRTGLEQKLSNIFNLSQDEVNVLIDIPTDKNKKLGEDINVKKYDGSFVKITSLSGIISGILDNFDDHLKMFRVFLAPVYKDEINGKKTEIKKIIRDYLRATL